jgi:spore germination cell wall hydrolase CwlJ-like protein
VAVGGKGQKGKFMKVFGARGASAVRGIFALAAASMMATAAPAQVATANATVAQAPSAATVYLSGGQAVKAPSAPTVYLGSGQALKAAVSTPAATIAQTPFAMARSLPLTALVAFNSVGAQLDEQGHCLAVAVYHEARGESLEGQLAVANVVINRSKSGKYPDSWCEVVKQPWQFSFVDPRTGQYPAVKVNSRAWRNAEAIARIAASNTAAEVEPDVLWYHADYVAPSWGKRLTLVEKIGTHIFYRA